MIIENPLLPALIGAIIGLACFGLWYAFRHWMPLLVGSIAVFCGIAVVALSVLIDSPREEVERTVHRLAMAAQNNDIEMLLRYVSPSAVEVRNAAKLEMEATRFVSCWIAKIHDIKIDETKSPPAARASLAVIAIVEGSRYGDGRGRVQLWLDLVKESDGQWRVVGYRYSIE